ncbi:transposase-like protein [Sporosarcina luteola]|nr:transposase-like protein [Sporosarcina luteola]
MNKPRHYTFEEKKEVVELFFEGHPVAELTRRFNLSNRRRVYDWAKKVRDANSFEALRDSRGLMNKGRTKQEDMAEENERLKLEILYLKKLLHLKRG